jgi:hypothetical protein
MTTEKKYFLKDLRFAYKVDERPLPIIKKVYRCCPQCDEKPIYKEKGFLVYTKKSRTALKKEGIMVSALVWYDFPIAYFPRAEDDGRCTLCEGWGCIDCHYSGGY